MFKFARLAAKNVFRNTRRTVITGLVLVFGATALILAGGFISSSFRGLRENTIHGELGHIQVYNGQYFGREEDRPLEYGITDADSLRKMISALPHVEYAMVRIDFLGLISNGDKSVIYLGKGIEPALESRLTDYSRAIDSGSFLPTTPTNAADAEVMIARGLAKSLHAKIGDYLTMMSTTTNGALNALDVRVAGIYSTGVPEYDERALMVRLETARQLLNTRRSSKLVVVLDKTDETMAVASAIQKMLPDVALRRWDQLATFYQAVVRLYSAIFLFLGVIIFIVVVLSCSNTMMMSIFERTKEIGTQLAVGTSRIRLLLNFLYEGLTIGVLGGTAGLALAFGLTQLIDHAGIIMPPPPGLTRGYPLHVDIVPAVFLGVFVVITVMTVLSTIIPALKASRLKIVDALGHI